VLGDPVCPNTRKAQESPGIGERSRRKTHDTDKSFGDVQFYVETWNVLPMQNLCSCLDVPEVVLDVSVFYESALVVSDHKFQGYG